MKNIFIILVLITLCGCTSTKYQGQRPETQPCISFLKSLHNNDLELFKSVWSEESKNAVYQKTGWDVAFNGWKKIGEHRDLNPKNYSFEFSETENGGSVLLRHETGVLISTDPFPVIFESGTWKIDMPE